VCSGLDVVAQQGEHLAQVLHRRAGHVADRKQRLPGGCGVVLGEVRPDGGLDGDDSHRVRQHVVQVAGDPQPLLDERQPAPVTLHSRQLPLGGSPLLRLGHQGEQGGTPLPHEPPQQPGSDEDGAGPGDLRPAEVRRLGGR
jgi:hypothetical protein